MKEEKIKILLKIINQKKQGIVKNSKKSKK